MAKSPASQFGGGIPTSAPSPLLSTPTPSVSDPTMSSVAVLGSDTSSPASSLWFESPSDSQPRTKSNPTTLDPSKLFKDYVTSAQLGAAPAFAHSGTLQAELDPHPPGTPSHEPSLHEKMQQMIDDLDIDNGLKETIRQVVNHHANPNPQFEELHGITIRDYQVIKDITNDYRWIIAKPRLLYSAPNEILIIHWPIPTHEAAINAADCVFAKETALWSYPAQLTHIEHCHNEQVEESGDVFVPDYALQFVSHPTIDGPPSKVANPIICQVSFSETFTHAMDRLEAALKDLPSCMMAILCNITESPAYASPPPSKQLVSHVSSTQIRSQEDFTSNSNLAGRAVVAFTDPVIVHGHTWSAILNADVYVWLRDLETGSLDIRTTAAAHAARGSLRSGEGMDAVESMIGRGLQLTKQSLITLCNHSLSTSGTQFEFQPLQDHTPQAPEFASLLRLKLKDASSRTAFYRYKAFKNSLDEGDQHQASDARKGGLSGGPGGGSSGGPSGGPSGKKRAAPTGASESTQRSKLRKRERRV